MKTWTSDLLVDDISCDQLQCERTKNTKRLSRFPATGDSSDENSETNLQGFVAHRRRLKHRRVCVAALCLFFFLKTLNHVAVNSHRPFVSALSCYWKRSLAPKPPARPPG